MFSSLIMIISSLGPGDVGDAKIALRQIQQIRGNLTRHLVQLNRFAESFRVLTEDDKKIKAKIKFLQNAGKVQRHDFSLTEVPMDGPQSGPPYVASIPNGFSRFFLRSSSDFEFRPRKRIPGKKMTFDPPSQLSCLVTTFSISFQLPDGGTVDLNSLTLGDREIREGIEYPANVLFQQMIIKPITNRGNETHNCFPGFHLYGLM
jgi:hypothetical protein